MASPFALILFNIKNNLNFAQASDFPNLAVKIMHAEPLAVPQPPYSPQLAGLVKDMLEKNPHKRTSLKAVRKKKGEKRGK